MVDNSVPPFSSPLAQWGAWGIIAMIVLFIATGRLIARQAAKDLVEQANKTTEQANRNTEQANRTADRWQTAFEASDKRADLYAQQLGEVVAALRSVETLVRESSRRNGI